jgi:flagellar biosynthesis/type III secretory pathway protein FliH
MLLKNMEKKKLITATVDINATLAILQELQDRIEQLESEANKNYDKGYDMGYEAGYEAGLDAAYVSSQHPE